MKLIKRNVMTLLTDKDMIPHRTSSHLQICVIIPLHSKRVNFLLLMLDLNMSRTWTIEQPSLAKQSTTDGLVSFANVTFISLITSFKVSRVGSFGSCTSLTFSVLFSILFAPFLLLVWFFATTLAFSASFCCNSSISISSTSSLYISPGGIKFKYGGQFENSDGRNLSDH